MDIFLLIGLLILLALFLGLVLFWKLTRKEYFPYNLKPFMTMAEKNFFMVLQTGIGQEYYVFPQVQIASLLEVDGRMRGKEFWKYFARIHQKSLDYVVTDKQTLEPLAVIELDDLSHQQKERVKRDELVNKALAAAHIPILRIKTQHAYNPHAITQRIKTAIAGREL